MRLRLARDPRLLRALAVAVGAVFVYASWDKVLAPSEFARIIYHYRLIGPSALVGPQPANLLAIVLPWIELVTGGLLILGLWRREAAVCAAGMLVTFLIAVSWALMLGIDVENCGCFSVTGAGRGFGFTLLATDTLLLIAAGLVATGPETRPAVEATASPPSHDEPATA